MGLAQIAELTPSDGAFISLAGYAWEELHGDIAYAKSDLDEGYRLADEASESSGKLLDEAREFVRVGDELIRYAALGILAGMPKAGVLTGNKLNNILSWFRPTHTEYARAAVNRMKPQRESARYSHTKRD